MNASVYEFQFSSFNIHTNYFYRLGTQNHEICIEKYGLFQEQFFTVRKANCRLYGPHHEVPSHSEKQGA